MTTQLDTFSAGTLEQLYPAAVGDRHMVPPRDILSFVRAEPFRPFRIRMTSGRTFEIRHPEMIRVGMNSMVIFTYVSDSPDLYDKWETVSLMLIESITHLEAPVA